MTHVEIARKLKEARETRTALKAWTDQGESLTVEQAYAVQEAGLEMALAAGEKLCGYKMGLTSRAKQRDVNVHEPIRGYLLASQEVPKGGAVDTKSRIHPRVEPEIAVTLKTPLAGPGVSLRHVVAALDTVVPALEILDSRYEGFSFRLPDVIADNTSASGFLLGSCNWANRLGDVPLLGVSLRKNGEVLETGAPAAVLGDPLLSVVALANSLGREGRRIEPGMVILTGGITASVTFQAGDTVEIVWPVETLSFRAV